MSKQIYLIEYDFDGVTHGDVMVLDDEFNLNESIVDWLNANLEDGEFTSADILSANPVSDLTDAEGNLYAIKHTISEYLSQVKEGSMSTEETEELHDHVARGLIKQPKITDMPMTEKL
jgi:hypothetical protein